MAKQVVWNKRAIVRFDEIVNYLEEEEEVGEQSARIFVTSVYSLIEKLKKYPEIGRRSKNKKTLLGTKIRFKVKYLLLLLPILSSFQELGQAEDSRLLKGKLVIDDKIMIGAPIYLINTVKNGTVTDLQGYFELEVPKNQDFKLQVGICICSTRPKPVRINSNEVEVLLNLRKCQVRKKVVEKASEASKHP